MGLTVSFSFAPPPCLSTYELTQSSPLLFMVPLWSHCRSRSLSLMLSVNEVVCNVPGSRGESDIGLHTELEGSSSSSSSPSFSSSATLTFLTAPVTEDSGPTLIFIFNFFLNSTCASWVRREKGEGCTGRHWQEVASPFTVISASAVLSCLPQGALEWQ